MCTLYNDDCLNIMPNIENKSVDLILVDPPYGTTNNKWDSVIPFDKMWEQYKRIIKPNGAIVMFSAQPFTSALIMSNPKWFKYEWVWDKHAKVNFLNANRQPLRQHENIVVFYNKQCTYNPQMTKGKMREKGGYGGNRQSSSYNKFHNTKNRNDTYFPADIISISNADNSKKLHPTEKPVELMEYLVKTYTNEGELVLDNCMGSGTTGVACKNLNRRFIGIEMDKEYFNIAKERIGQCQI